MIIFKKLPIYHIKIALIITEKTDILKQHFTKESLDRTGILDKDELYSHTLWVDKDGDIVLSMLFNFNTETNITLGTIVHEAIHIKNMLFLYLGINNDLENDEPEAYLIEYITDWIIDNLKEQEYIRLKIKTKEDNIDKNKA